MTSFRRTVSGQLDTLAGHVDKISRAIERIEVATIVREPSSALSVDAYEGLRRQVVAAAGERMAHLYQLARFAEAVSSAMPVEQLGPLVEEWLIQAGLERVTDLYDGRYYDVLAGDGPQLRVLRTAYRDGATARPVLMGQVERTAAPGAEAVAAEQAEEVMR